MIKLYYCILPKTLTESKCASNPWKPGVNSRIRRPADRSLDRGIPQNFFNHRQISSRCSNLEFYIGKILVIPSLFFPFVSSYERVFNQLRTRVVLLSTTCLLLAYARVRQGARRSNKVCFVFCCLFYKRAWEGIPIPRQSHGIARLKLAMKCLKNVFDK